MVLLQTIVDQHGSSINQLLFLEKGRILLSSSSDRTVSIHALAIANASMAYIATRTITLKASPMSMTVTPEDPTILIISTMDRQLHKYDVSTGQLIYSVRLWDDETHESILLSSITMRTDENHGSFRRIVLGVSSTDKSVRVHDLETGATIVKDYGHSEGISDIATIQNEVLRGNACYTLISTSFDGTIMLWDLRCQTSMPAEINMPVTPAQDGTNSSKPLRRILSRSVLAEYSKSLEANGPSSPATPRRSQSPSRLRRKPSRFSIANPSTSRTIPSFNRPLNRSPSPTSPSTPIIEKQRPALDRSRTKSVGNFNESKVSMEQMCRSLRALRKKLLTASEILRSEGANELERELGLTSNAIMQHKKRQQAASESIETIVLERSSEKLAKTVEQKVAIEIAKHGGSSIEEASPSIMVIEKTGSSAESVGKG